MSDRDREVLQIADPKTIQDKIDAVPREKLLQATSEVSHGQLTIRNGAIAEGNSQSIDLTTVNAKVDIKSTLFLVEEAKSALDELELGHAAKKMYMCLCRAKNCLGTHESAFLANAGIKYASIAMGDVEAKTVHGVLRRG